MRSWVCNNRNVFGLLLLIVTQLMLVGCSSSGKKNFVEPQIYLIKAEVVKARLLEQRFLLRFHIDNPNDDDLLIRRLDYHLYLNDIELAEGRSSKWFKVPAQGNYELDVTANTNLWRHIRPLIKMLEKPEQPIPYRLHTRLKTGLLLRRNLYRVQSGEIIPAQLIPK